MASAWKDTPTKWYPIPIALGAAVLVAVNYAKSSPRSSSVNDRIEVMGDGEHGAQVNVKSSGPWQVRVMGALPLRSLSQVWGYLNGLVLPVWFRPFGFKLYARIFGCNLEEMEEQDLTKYQSLGEFFYRTLKPGVRPIDTSAEMVSFLSKLSLVDVLMIIVLLAGQSGGRNSPAFR
jgi:phosphatidylserine decarboxylase